MFQTSNRESSSYSLVLADSLTLLTTILLWAVLASGCSSRGPVKDLKYPETIDPSPSTDRIAQLERGQAELLRQLRSTREEIQKTCARDTVLAVKRPGAPEFGQTYRVAIDDAHHKGPADALVTVVIWSNFSCPFCQLANAAMQTLQLAYRDELRFVFKHNPLPSVFTNTTRAAMVAEAAGQQGKFWEMHDLLFANPDQHSEKSFLKWAKKLRLNIPQFQKALRAPTLKRRIQAHRAQAHALGAKGTPSFFINGRYIGGAVSLRRYAQVVDQAMRDAKKLEAQGVSKRDVYAAIIAGRPSNINAPPSAKDSSIGPAQRP